MSFAAAVLRSQSKMAVAAAFSSAVGSSRVAMAKAAAASSVSVNSNSYYSPLAAAAAAGGGGGAIGGSNNNMKPAVAAAQQSASFWSTPPVSEDKAKTAVGEDEDKTATSGILTTSDLVKVIAESHHLSQAESKRILDTVFHTITEALASKQPVRIVNFGSFATVETKQREGRNPKTGEPLTIPAGERVRFRAFTALKNTVKKQQH